MIRILCILFVSLAWSVRATADDSFQTAKRLGTKSKSFGVRDWVGARDNNDFYRFRVSKMARVKFSLSGMQDNANLALYDRHRQELAVGTQPGVTPEEFTRILEPGEYYLRVGAWNDPQYGWSNTNYSLQAQFIAKAGPTNPPADFGGDTLNGATPLGHLYLQKGQPYYTQEWIGHGKDTHDYYHFAVWEPQERQRFAARMDLPANARLELYQATGNAKDPWDLVLVSRQMGPRWHEMRAYLAPGEYVIGVSYSGTTPLRYQLEMFALRHSYQREPF